MLPLHRSASVCSMRMASMIVVGVGRATKHAAGAETAVLHALMLTELGVQDLCCVVSTLASLQGVGFNADVQGCLVAAKQQLQQRFQQGRDVSVPTLCQVCTTHSRTGC